MKKKTCLVIGAGVSGLCAGRRLTEAGHEVVIVEREAVLGGVWVYTEDDGKDGKKKTSMYRDLVTNQASPTMELEGFPHPPDTPSFVHRSFVLKYINDFAQHFNLRCLIEFSTNVEEVTANPEHDNRESNRSTSNASTSGSNSGESASSLTNSRSSNSIFSDSNFGDSSFNSSDTNSNSVDSNFISSGSNSSDTHLNFIRNSQSKCNYNSSNSSSMPSSKEWRVTTRNPVTEEMDVRYFDVVVVCTGHFAEPNYPDIKNITKFPGQTVHSREYHSADCFESKTVMVVGGSFSAGDIALEIAAKAQKVFLSTRNLLMKWQYPSNTEVVSDVAEYNDATGSVITADGRHIHVDAIVYCTGYKYSFPFLSGSCCLEVDDNRLWPLYQHLVHMAHPESLFFVGITSMTLIFKMSDLQSRAIARIVSGLCSVPNRREMEEETKAEMQRRLSNGIPKRYFHTLGCEMFDYGRALARWTGVEAVPVNIERLLYQAAARLRSCQDFKKDVWVKRDEDGEYVNARQ